MKTKNKKVLILFFLFTLSFFYNSKASDYYWVGGTGNWSDYTNHWAISSGGLIFHIQTPGPFDNVIFDANSFTAPGDTVKIDSTLIYCNDMTWTGAAFNPLLNLTAGVLKIYGSLALAANMTFGTGYSGTISFESTSPGKTITSAGTAIKTNISFNGIGGSWSLNDALTLTGPSSDYIYIGKGSFYTNNFPVTCNGDFDITTSGTVDLGSSVIDCSSYDDHTAGSVTAAATTINCGTFDGYNGRTYQDVNCGNLYCGNGVFNDVTCGGISGSGNTFHNVLFLSYGHITGSNTFHKATFLNGNIIISGSSSFDSLLFNSGVLSVTLASGTTQTINDVIVADGSCTNWIPFRSSTLGTQATLSKSSGAVTVSYLLLTDINAAGGAAFTANNSVDMGNVTGWTINASAPQNLYWVGGTGNWNDANHWSTSSGGTGGACLPSPFDNVFYDANSFSSAGDTVYVNVSQAYCNDMTWTGAAFNPLLNLTAGVLKIYGSLALAANMTFGTGYSGTISFESTSPGKTITSAGTAIKTNISFNGIGGSWSLNDALTLTGPSSDYIYIGKGSFYTNNFPVTCNGDFDITTSGTVDLGSSVIDCSSYDDHTAGSVTAAATTINCGTFDGYNGRTYQDVNCGNLYCGNGVFNDVTCGGISGSGNTFHNVLFLSYGHITGSNTFHKATFLNGNIIISGSSSFDSLLFNSGVLSVTLASGTTQTINDVIVADGSCTNWIPFRSSTLGTQATLSKSSGAVTVSYLLLTDINAAGGAAFTANNSVDMGNVTGWTINASAPQNLYWVGGTGNWNDANHWSTSSGGTGGACLPSPFDNVFYDANSFSSAGDTVYVNVSQAYCNDMTWTGAAFNPLLNLTAGVLKIYGSLALAANMTFGTGYSGTISFESTSPGKTITSAGTAIKTNISFNGIGGSWSLNDALTLTGPSSDYIYIGKGSFYTNNFPVTCNGDFDITTSGTVDLGSSVIDCSSYDDHTAGSVTAAATTINCGTFDGYNGRTYQDVNCGNLYCGNGVFNDVTCGGISGSGNTFHNVLFLSYGHITGSNTFHKATFLNGNIIISGSSSFDTLFFNNPGNSITLSLGTTQTINNELMANTLPGFPVLLRSSSLGTQATISKSSGDVCLNYFIMQDINATGGAQFYAGDYSTDLGNNTGWSFTSCVPAISNVWPGDANYDLICDNLDILNIGVAYNDTGYVRPAASLTWVAQPNLNWLSQFMSGVNAKHADCDGNGIVEALDTLAVSQNYGLTHPFRLSSPDNTTSAGTDLYFDMPAGSLVPGSSVSIPINFGTQTTPANNAYGIAFTISYSSALVEAGSMYIDYTGSWMATPANYIHLEKDFSATGDLDMGMCRINHQNVSGYGMIATLHFIVDNNASGLLTLSFSDVLAISNNELQIPVNPFPGSVLTGMDEASAEDVFTLYPNPVKDYLYFNAKDNDELQFEIYNAFGQKIVEFFSDKKKIYLGNISNGVYMIRAQDKNYQKTFQAKFIKE